MPKEFSRSLRVADQIQRDLARLLQQEMKDPRLGMLTLSGVKISKDMMYADVYFTMLSLQEQSSPREAEKLLNQAAGYLRTELAKMMRLRAVPQLRFHYDHTLEKGNHVSGLITQAMREDKSRQDQQDQGEDE
ncbi:30S ribosome-binding factor RbfA [Balneatrix alpica]|uniref:Ribosome-binding factor A n=1 Tax=Balneatrix alpica TaxID=75684 RepID=A0ABV5ZBI4_9GAMM|nr:30S ribosome-binding factor RbfA [Balneatrix alpica]